LLKKTYAALKAENPAAVVLGGAVAGLDDNWIADFIRAGGLAYVDGFSIHPYVQSRARNTPSPPTRLTLDGMKQSAVAVGRVPLPGTPEDAMAWIDRLETLIGKGAPGKSIPIYITEIGWPTNVGGDGVSEEASAAYLQRFMLMARTRPWIAGVWWYDLIDDGSDPRNGEHRFGLLRQNGAPKPSFDALSKISPFLQASSEPVETLGPQGEVVITGQSRSGSQFTAVWEPTSDFTSMQQTKSVGATPTIKN
jgi:hypothetical protein